MLSKIISSLESEIPRSKSWGTYRPSDYPLLSQLLESLQEDKIKHPRPEGAALEPEAQLPQSVDLASHRSKPKVEDRYQKYVGKFQNNPIIEKVLTLLSREKTDTRITFAEFRAALLTAVQNTSLKELSSFKLPVIKDKNPQTATLVRWTNHVMALFNDPDTQVLFELLDKHCSRRLKTLDVSHLFLSLKEIMAFTDTRTTPLPAYHVRKALLKQIEIFEHKYAQHTSHTLSLKTMFETCLYNQLMKRSQQVDIDPDLPVCGSILTSFSMAGYQKLLVDPSDQLAVVAKKIKELCKEFPEFSHLLSKTFPSRNEVEQLPEPLFHLLRFCKIALLLDAQKIKIKDYPNCNLFQKTLVGTGPTFLIHPNDRIDQLHLVWRPVHFVDPHHMTIFIHIGKGGDQSFSLHSDPAVMEPRWATFDDFYKTISSAIHLSNGVKWLALQALQTPPLSAVHPSKKECKLVADDKRLYLETRINDGVYTPYYITIGSPQSHTHLHVYNVSTDEPCGTFSKLSSAQQWAFEQLDADYSEEYKNQLGECAGKHKSILAKGESFFVRIGDTTYPLKIQFKDIVVLGEPPIERSFTTTHDLFSAVQLANTPGETLHDKLLSLINHREWNAVSYGIQLSLKQHMAPDFNGLLDKIFPKFQTTPIQEAMSHLIPFANLMSTICGHTPLIPTALWLKTIQHFVDTLKRPAILPENDQKKLSGCLSLLAQKVNSSELDEVEHDTKRTLSNSLTILCMNSTPEISQGIYALIEKLASGHELGLYIPGSLSHAFKYGPRDPKNPQALGKLIEYMDLSAITPAEALALYNGIPSEKSEVRIHLLIAFGLKTLEIRNERFISIEELLKLTMQVHNADAFQILLEFYHAQGYSLSEQFFSPIKNPENSTLLERYISVTKKSAQWSSICDELLATFLAKPSLSESDYTILNGLFQDDFRVTPLYAQNIWNRFCTMVTSHNDAQSDQLAELLIKILKNVIPGDVSLSELLSKIQQYAFEKIQSAYEKNHKLSAEVEARYRYLFSKTSRLLNVPDFRLLYNKQSFRFIISECDGHQTVLQLTNSGKKLPPAQIDELSKLHSLPPYTYFDDESGESKTIEFGMEGYIVGKGQFGKVTTALDFLGNRILAVKKIAQEVVAPGDVSGNGLSFQEFSHPNILRPIGDVLLVNKKNIQTQYVFFSLGQKSFKAVLTTKTLSQGKKEAYAAALIDVVLHLHDHGVYHHDLKLDNVVEFETEEKDSTLKLLDFGCASTSETCGLDGSSYYFPPDMYLQRIKPPAKRTCVTFNSEVKDSYALGILLAGIDLERIDLSCLHFDDDIRARVGPSLAKAGKPINNPLTWVESRGARSANELSIPQGDISPIRWAMYQLLHPDPAQRKTLRQIREEFQERYGAYVSFGDQYLGKSDSTEAHQRHKTMVHHHRKVRALTTSHSKADLLALSGKVVDPKS